MGTTAACVQRIFDTEVKFVTARLFCQKQNVAEQEEESDEDGCKLWEYNTMEEQLAAMRRESGYKEFWREGGDEQEEEETVQETLVAPETAVEEVDVV